MRTLRSWRPINPPPARLLNLSHNGERVKSAVFEEVEVSLGSGDNVFTWSLPFEVMAGLTKRSLAGVLVFFGLALFRGAPLVEAAYGDLSTKLASLSEGVVLDSGGIVLRFHDFSFWHGRSNIAAIDILSPPSYPATLNGETDMHTIATETIIEGDSGLGCFPIKDD